MKSWARFGLAILLLAVPVPPARAQSGYDLFQRALVSERNDGDLQQAIALYRRIADEYAADRQLAARALLRLGGVYELLGSAEATTTFNRLVRDFADQEAEVADARERLVVLRPAPAPRTDGPPTRRLIEGSGRVTRDGNHLLRYNEERRAFELVEIESQSVRVLTSDGPDPDRDVVEERQILSADGRRIAAILTRSDPNRPRGQQTTRMQLRVFDVGGGGEGRPIFTWEAPEYVLLRPIGWSPDQARIWLWGIRRDLAAEIASVDVEGGSFEVLKTLAWRAQSQAPSLSPDGRFIAYHDAARETPADVFILATDGSREVRLEHPADDSKPLFAPDGSGVVFGSNRRGGIRDLWFMPLADGRPSGDARIVWPDIAPYGTARAFAGNGSLFYYFATTRWEIYTAELDLGAGVVGHPEHVEPLANEMNEAPAFSPDGRHLAHVRGRRRLVLRDLDTGAEREFPLPRSVSFPLLDWCPQGDFAFVTGYQKVAVAVRVDLKQGGAERVPLADPQRVLCLGEGDDIVYLQGPSLLGGPQRIVRRSLATGAEKTLYEGQLSPYQVTRSLDGTKVAFVQIDTSEAHLMVMPATGGEPRSVATSPLSRQFGRVRTEFQAFMWLPDGDTLLIVRGPGNPSPEELVTFSRLAVDSGVETEVGRMRLPAFEGGFYGAVRYSLHPRGSQVAFQLHAGSLRQVWAIDNLLQFIQSGESASLTPNSRGR